MLGDRLWSSAIALALCLTGCAEAGGRPRNVTFATGPQRFGAEVEGRIRRLEAALSLPQRMAHYNVPGVSIAVVQGGVVEWARGYGVAEANGQTPVTQDTVFQAASVSKPVT